MAHSEYSNPCLFQGIIPLLQKSDFLKEIIGRTVLPIPGFRNGVSNTDHLSKWTRTFWNGNLFSSFYPGWSKLIHKPNKMLLQSFIPSIEKKLQTKPRRHFFCLERSSLFTDETSCITPRLSLQKIRRSVVETFHRPVTGRSKIHLP